MLENIVVYSDGVKSICGEVSKRLSSSEVNILIALIEAGGEVVSRSELMRVGWPEKIVVANSLNMAILSIRRALFPFGKDKNVVTMPRIGFRLEQCHTFSYEKIKMHESDMRRSDELLSNHHSPKIKSMSVFSECATSVDSGKFEGAEVKGIELQVGCYDNDHYRHDNICRRCSPSMSNGFFLFFTVLIFTLCFFVWRLHEVSKPQLECRNLVNRFNLCSTKLDLPLINSASIKVLQEHAHDEKIKYDVWVEVDPHDHSGYSFYYFARN